MNGGNFMSIREAAAMATAAYTFDAEPFLEQGWQDACAQLGPSFACGLNTDADEKTRGAFHAVLRAFDHRKALHRRLTSSVRQLRSGSGIKSMVLVRRQSDGRFLFCVSIMGSVQLDDWLANFDMVTQNGVHRGFLRRAVSFEDMEQSLYFPRTAEAFGLKWLSLRDVIQRCRLPDSPFVISVTGHSLGAAVMQVYIHRMLTVRGVLGENVQGVGFAAPSVGAVGFVEHPDRWPIRLIFNADDLIPHTGAQVHLGRCFTYEPDMALREACYDYPDSEEAIAARQTVRPIYDALTDTGACFCFGLALLELIADLPPETVLPFLGRLKHRWLPLQRVIDAGDSQADRFNRHLQRKAVAAYRSIYGERPENARIARFYEQLRAAVDRIGLQGLLSAIGQLALPPHKMNVIYTRIAERMEEAEE